jgi:hypothetical protein
MVDLLTSLDNDLAAAQKNLKTATESHNVDQGTISSLRQQISDLQSQIATLQKTNYTDSNPNYAGIGLHLLPFVTDPNARPLLQWFQPSNTGDTGGGSSAKHGRWAANPATVEGTRELDVDPAYAFNNFFFGLNLVKGNSLATTYKQFVVFEIKDADVPHCNAIETNWEHCITVNGKRFRYNQGTQIYFNAKQVRYYDIASSKWVVLPGVPCPTPGTGKLISVLNEVERTQTGMHFVALTINGQRVVVDKTKHPVGTPWSEYLQYGFQMDTLGGTNPPAYTCVLHDAQATWR